MAKTIEEIMNDLNQFGESLNNLQPELEELSRGILSEMKSRAPVDTGALKNSIRSEITSSSLTIFMNDYGNFQNYGVGPNTIINKVEFGINPQPASPPFYMFKTRKFGLPAKAWFSLEQIKEELAQELGTQIIARTF